MNVREKTAEDHREKELVEKVRRVLWVCRLECLPGLPVDFNLTPRTTSEMTFQGLLRHVCLTCFGISPAAIGPGGPLGNVYDADTLDAVVLQLSLYSRIILDTKTSIDQISANVSPADRARRLLRHFGAAFAIQQEDTVAAVSQPFLEAKNRMVTGAVRLAFESYQLVKPLLRLARRLRIAREPTRKSAGKAWKRRLRDALLPQLDAIIVAVLENVLLRLPVVGTGVNDSRARALSPLLFLRGRLFLSLGGYTAAYECFRAALAWGTQGEYALFFTGVAAHLSGEFAEAEHIYRCDLVLGNLSAPVCQNLAHVLLAQGREGEAVQLLLRALQIAPDLRMAHQNMAGNYDIASYTLQALDNMLLAEVMLFDAYNVTGQQLVHIGRGDEGVVLYGKALRCQQALSEKAVIPSWVMHVLEDKHGLDPSQPVRILPYEWVTLIGHIAMLDSYKKLQLLGMSAPGQPVLLAPRHKVANQPYLDLWREHFHIIESPRLVEVLFPYQRRCGDCFNGYLRSDGSAADWTELAAHGQKAWDDAGRGPLIALPERIREAGDAALQTVGLAAGDWFVALHVRSSGFHREGAGSMQLHRNAALEDYVPAVKAITDCGGWVIRLGDSSMVPFPKMEGVIDYPHSNMKTPEMDVYLAATARFFFGTTSGLTNAVISLGTPCLLVNCISNYFQLWNNRTLFTLKPIWYERERRFLSISEMVAEDFRWKVFNINLLAHLGMVPLANTAEEIENAAREMLERLATGPVMRRTEADLALDAACRAGRNQGYFGNGRLSKSYFEARRADLFAG